MEGTEKKGNEEIPNYRHVQRPFEDLEIRTPVHPFAAVAHFNIRWCCLTAEERDKCILAWTDEQKERAILALGIWRYWSPSDSALAPGLYDGSSGYGSVFQDPEDNDPARTPSIRPSERRRRRDGNGDRTAQPGKRQRQSSGSCSRSRNRRRLASADVAQDGNLEDGPTDVKDDCPKRSVCSEGCINSNIVESEDDSEGDYNPLPEYAKRGEYDIPAWASRVRADFDLDQPGKCLPFTLDSSYVVKQDGNEKARSPPAGDWTKWKPDTSAMWKDALPPDRRDNLSYL
jgi:hypothetical protein